MKQTKKKQNWFMKFPVVPAFILPFVSTLAAIVLSGIPTAAVINAAPDLLSFYGEIAGIMMSVVRILIAFIIIIIMKAGTGRTFQFGFHMRNIRLSFILSFFCILLIADNVIEGLLFSDGLQTSMIGIAAAVIGGIAPGFFEEVVCRGFVVSNMMDKWQGRKNYVLKSVLASGIIFGLMHLMNLGGANTAETIMQIFYAAGLGIYFGAVYVRTRNLWGTVVMHALVDITYNMFLMPEEFWMKDLIIGIMIAVVYTVIGLYLIRPVKQKEIEELWEGKQ